MKAELENIVGEIEQSLSLLSKRVGFETAEFRLEELNAMCEDSNLWSDSEKATKLMLTARSINSMLIKITIIFFLFKNIPTTPIVKIVAARTR